MSSFFTKLLEPLRNQRGQFGMGTFLDELLGDPLAGFEPIRVEPQRVGPVRRGGGGFTTGTGGSAAGAVNLTPRLTPEEQGRFDAEVARAARFEREDLVNRLLAAGQPQAAAAPGLPRLQPTRFQGVPQGGAQVLGFAPGSVGAQAGGLIQDIIRSLTGGGDFGGPSRADLLDPRLADIGEQFGAARGRTAERFAALGRSPVSTPQQELQQRLTQREATERQRAIGNVDEFLARLRLNQQTQLQNLLVRLLGIPGIGGQGGQIPRLR